MANAPGLKHRPRADGSIAWYWIASAVSRRAKDYPQKAVRIHATSQEEAALHAWRLTAELRRWLAERGQDVSPGFKGTIASLIDCYECDEDSPYRAVKQNTRRHYDQILRLVRDACGKRVIADLTRKDFARWYRGFREGERVRQAHNCMKLLRIVVNFGASMRYAGCRDAAFVLGEMRFELPDPRRSRMSYGQAGAIIDQALALGRPSIALAQALQFELSLRQKDVIGEWTKAQEMSGIVSHGQRWSGGVQWSDLAADMILTKQTTKTAAVGEWNVALSPLVTRALAAFPADKRVGPMIVSETTGLPYRNHDFQVKWRAIAKTAGVPDDVWNMDSRAGGISEGADSGAAIDDLRRHATHTDAKMTGRYVRGTLKATEKVARLRVAGRRNDGSGTL